MTEKRREKADVKKEIKFKRDKDRITRMIEENEGKKLMKREKQIPKEKRN